MFVAADHNFLLFCSKKLIQQCYQHAMRLHMLMSVLTCWQCLHIGCCVLIIRLCCACKHSHVPRAKKCYSPVVSESALKIGSFATSVAFEPPATQTYTHTCLYYSFEHLIQRRQCQRVRQMWGISAHFYKVSCESFFSLSLSRLFNVWFETGGHCLWLFQRDDAAIKAIQSKHWNIYKLQQTTFTPQTK